MASSKLIDIGVKLGKQLGANTNKFLGTRSNINFLGKGPDEGKLFQQDINTEVLGGIELKSALPEIETSLGYLTAGKLNDIQANKLIDNLTKMNDFYYPITGDSIANVTDMASRTGGLTRGGLDSLRGLNLKNLDNAKDAEGLAALRARTGDNNVPLRSMSEILANPRKMADEAAFPGETFNAAKAAAAESPLMSRLGDRVKNIQTQSDEASAIMETIPKNEIPGKTASAREFLLNALKDENVNRTVFRDIVSPQDLKAITEGGGGVDMDPIVLVQKYFGPRVAELLPSNATVDDIAIFTQRILNNATDIKGAKPTDPAFDKFTLRLDELSEGTYSFGYKKGKEFQNNVNSMGKGTLKQIIDSGELAGDDLEAALNALRSRKADGGRANYRFGGLTKSLLKKLNTKKIKAAVDDIFPSGDYKYDAEMAAEALVENNPKLFGGQLYDDLDDMIRSDVYGLVLKELSQRNALKLQARRAGSTIPKDEYLQVKANFENEILGGPIPGTRKPRGFSLNVEKAMSELNIPREEAERIARLSSDEQKAALQIYMDRSTAQGVQLMNYNPKKFDAAKGGLAKILEL